jgi:hypothetical protein
MKSILDVLNAAIAEAEERDPEIIGKSRLREVAPMVMLEIEHTPVLPHRVTSQDPYYVPVPVEAVQTQGGDYILRDPAFQHPVSAETLRDMRARYLLWRGHLGETFEQLPHSVKGQVAALYFGGHVPITLASLRKRMAAPDAGASGENG